MSELTFNPDCYFSHTGKPDISWCFYWVYFITIANPLFTHNFLISYLTCSLLLLKLTILLSSLRLVRTFYRRWKYLLRPQFGLAPIDPYLKEAILVWCLFENLRSSKDKRGMIAAIVTYLQAHTNMSLPARIYSWFKGRSTVQDWNHADGLAIVNDILAGAFDIQDPAPTPTEDGVVLDQQFGIRGEDGEFTPWYEIMDKAFSNWQTFRRSSVVRKFTRLINVIVSAGMCSAASLEFKMGNVHLFSPVVESKQLCASDVFEAFYESVSGFMQGGWRAFSTGEVSAFFAESDQITEFENLYNKIRSQHGFSLPGNLQEYKSMCENDHELELLKGIELGETILKKIPRHQGFERKTISDRVERLRDYHIEFSQLRSKGGLRISPFAISLFGSSGCGKSSLTSLTINAGLIYNGKDASKERIATWADNDKYASSLRSHINAIIFDDFANTKETFLDFSPAYRLIQVINNIRYMAPMADVFLKGKVSLNPYFCIVSTNVEMLNAQLFSNEPESILRRLYHVKVVPKEECCSHGMLDKSKIRDLFGVTPKPDAWLLTIRKYDAQNAKAIDPNLLKPVTFKGKVMENVSVSEYLEWVQITSKKHFEEEKEFTSTQEAMPSTCSECGLVYCNCVKKEETSETPKLDQQSGVLVGFLSSLCDYWSAKSIVLKEYYATASHQKAIFIASLCLWWERFDILPVRFVCHPLILKFCLIFWQPSIVTSLVLGNAFILIWIFMAIVYVNILAPVWLAIGTFLCYWYTCVTFQTFERMVGTRLLECRNIVKSYMATWQTRHALIGIGAIGLVLTLLRSRYSTLNEQTGLDPENYAEIEERNAQHNQWAKAEISEVPMAAPSKTTTASNLIQAMRPNIVSVVSENSKVTLGFFATTNCLIIPRHYLDIHPNFAAKKADIKVKIYKTVKGEVGHYVREILAHEFTYLIPGTDFAMVYVTSVGSVKDLWRFFPLNSEIPITPAVLVTRGILERSLKVLPTLFRGKSLVKHTTRSFIGGYYTLETPTVDGMCMSPLLSEGKGSVILGFHLGGKGKLGGCGILTKDQVIDAILEIEQIDGTVLTASCGTLRPNMGDLPKTSYGQTILTSTNIHSKSAVNFLPEGSNVEIYGETLGRSTPYSSVEDTGVADHVSDVFNRQQKWGPPKMKGKGVYPYQVSLEAAAMPSLPLGSVLAKSVRCYKSIATKLHTQIPKLFNIGPLSRVETVSGVDGLKFIDAMNFSTSPGFPHTGDKKKFLVDLDPEDYPNITQPRTFISEVWAEFDRACETLLSGQRCYFVWKSCLKDEPTLLTKEKVRVFQSAPLVLQLIIRMYFLPLVRIIQMNPIRFECAVGINCEGNDWEEMWQAAMKKGSDRVLAGDYSKYDLRMPAQVTLAAFDILISMADQCDMYDYRDIRLMKMLVAEISYPLMAYNGDLIQLFGTNPSGQNLTVIINSIVNSLLLRSCFYTKYPNLVFKDECSFLTYGDDVIGTVSEKVSDFTHITYAEYLAEHDMKFTMPDKESEPVHYMSEKDVDFLKRKSQYNPDLGCEIGLLDEESIFKRLFSRIHSKILPDNLHDAQSLDSALYDWFFYGREIFEEKQKSLLEVAHRAGITHLCTGLHKGYDERCNQWHIKYSKREPIEEEIVVLDQQCGDMFVSTVDYFDHCRGSVTDRFFFWEHWLASTGPFVPVLLSYLFHKGYYFKIGIPTKPWILILTVIHYGHLLSFTLWFFQVIFWTYAPYYYMQFLYNSAFKVISNLLGGNESSHVIVRTYPVRSSLRSGR